MKSAVASASGDSAQDAAPTVRELAAELGLHHATVARALGNQPNVALATRQRILQAAQQRGYRRNALIKALMTQVRRRHRLKPTGEVVAFLTSYEDENQWRKLPSLSAQFEGAWQRATELGFSLQPMWMGNRGAMARQTAGILEARGVRGSLLAPLPSGSDDTEAAQGLLSGGKNRGVLVAIGYSWKTLQIHRAVHDSVGQASECATRLHAAGCKRIGLVLPKQYGMRGRHLLINGYLGACWSHDLAKVPPLLLGDPQTPGNPSKDEACFKCWFNKYRLDAVIGLWPDQPLQWLRAQSVQVPDDVCYATLDLGDRFNLLAGMEQGNYTIGASAMDLLASQLFRNETSAPPTPTVTLVSSLWHNGPTIK